MTVQKLVWIVVIALFICVAFTGGVALATMNSRQVTFAGLQTGPAGMMRAPNSGAVPFGYGAQPGTGRGNRMMPGYGRGNIPNGRGTMPRFAPNQRRAVPPSNRQMNPPGRGTNRFARPQRNR